MTIGDLSESLFNGVQAAEAELQIDLGKKYPIQVDAPGELNPHRGAISLLPP